MIDSMIVSLGAEWWADENVVSEVLGSIGMNLELVMDGAVVVHWD
jgi:hypothetical protein